MTWVRSGDRVIVKTHAHGEDGASSGPSAFHKRP